MQVLLIGVWLMFVGVIGYTQRGYFLAGRNDFAQLYAGARLSGTALLYDPDANREIQKQVLGGFLPSVYYSRPPFYAFILRPLGALPYQAAYWTFEALSALALMGFLKIWTPRCRELLFFAGVSLPVLADIFNGQDVAFVLLAAALAVEAMRRKWDFAAGLLLSFCAVKFHLFLCVPIVLLLHRRWKVLNGGIAGGLLLIGVSFFSDGVDWPKRYLQILLSPGLNPRPDLMPNLHGLVFSLSSSESGWLLAVLSLAVLAAVIYIALHNALEFSFAFALVGSLLISYHAYFQDCTLLMLVFVLVLKHSRSVLLRSWVAIAFICPTLVFFVPHAPWTAAVPLALLALLPIGVFRPAHSEPEAAGLV